MAIAATGSMPSSRAGMEGRGNHGSPSQKTTLWRALRKANTAVMLDNAHNFEGAVEAYAEAGQLLQQVMRGSTGDDRKKLESIRVTYSNRVSELHSFNLDLQRIQDKALPERPLSSEILSPQPSPVDDVDEDPDSIDPPTALGAIHNHHNTHHANSRRASYLDPSRIPPRRQSLLPSAMEKGGIAAKNLHSAYYTYGVDRNDAVYQPGHIDENGLRPDCLPAPLSISPLRATIPNGADSSTVAPSDSESNLGLDTEPVDATRHSRDNSTETTSWLDTIDESGGSSASSLHSRSSSFGIHRKRIDMVIGEANAELSAAMDAAVEAAYNDARLHEADDDGKVEEESSETESYVVAVSRAKRNVERARQRVRQAEQEDLVQARRRWGDDQAMGGREKTAVGLEYLDEEAEEEERLLEQMTGGYFMDDSQFGLQSKKSLSHQSDVSTVSGKNWSSSNTSRSVTTTTTSSSTALAEGIQKIPHQKASPPYPPPLGALSTPLNSTETPPIPPAPSLPPPRPPSAVMSPAPGVRARRLSGQNAKQLKIETHSRQSSASLEKNLVPVAAPISSVEEEPATSSDFPQLHPPNPSAFVRRPVPQISQTTPQTPMTSVPSETPMQDESPVAPALPKVEMYDTDEPVPASPARFMGISVLSPGLLLKNVSSSSLKTRNLSVAPLEVSDTSPITPGSATFSISANARKGSLPSLPVLPTPTGNTFTANGLPTAGIYLFDDQVCSPVPTSPSNTLISDPPLPLEPCPEGFLLRPFWLLRCLYQTVAHPRGGYLSARLFVPRNAWRVKNVKLKSVEEKVAHCDLVTAALLKVAMVDTLDADSVLDEMQSLEVVLDQVRTSLHKKLGSEVGADGAVGFFKGPATAEDGGAHAEAHSSKSGSMGSKSYLSSWKKLRSKSSGAALTSVYSAPLKDGGRDHVTMASLPMTSAPTGRPPKRDFGPLRFSGPNADYMGALARLCDAAQVVDSIARQVEDPGLKFSSKTHVGLELSTRNAADFFAFYICRFALHDVGMLLDKFVKRGSEWVLV